MKYETTFAVSDIHGEYEKFIELLQHWDPDSMNLIIMGDLIDRGNDSLKVVQKAMQLRQDYGEQVVVLKGNHEDMLMMFLQERDYGTGSWYFNNGGNKTYESFIEEADTYFHSYEVKAHKMSLKTNEIEFIRDLPLFQEFGNVLFVHAGINPFISDWKQGDVKDFLWTRGHWNHKNETNKHIVFGHTPTQFMHNSQTNNNVWISNCGTNIAIDGGAVFGGQLNGIVIDKNGKILNTISV
ncbi:metallophosphoesterase family protein [Bacillus sp. ChL18]|uniref:metallophosphoesterase family protein n=1 Tax=Bacillus TaxID=1386 RepID=UPI002248F373|nr:metallophosphoesterase family protein [Bacillus sp. ChL18]MCX2809604.1 metallophosphoesterase family protein [Bacillus sp. ChL18]